MYGVTLRAKLATRWLACSQSRNREPLLSVESKQARRGGRLVRFEPVLPIHYMFAMKATPLEYRHQTLFHLLLVGVAVLTYLCYPVDLVWALVRSHANNASLERVVFGVGALLLLGSAVLETWAKARPGLLARSNRLVLHGRVQNQVARTSLYARILLVLAVGLLLPWAGTVVLLAGETILIARLFFWNEESAAGRQFRSLSSAGSWGSGFRAAAPRWGLAASMILFAWTLQDRIAEVGAACSMVLWLALNVPAHIRSQSR